MRAYRDPSTGAFVAPPSGSALAAPNAPAVPAALSEEAAPGGGRMIRLHGAFRSQMVGRLETDGARAVSCASTAGPTAGPTAR